MKAGRCVLGMGEGTGHLWAQIKGQRCGKLPLYPLPQRGASCSPAEVPETAPAQACTQNISFWLNCSQDSLKAKLGKSHKFSFSNTEFLPAHWSSSYFQLTFVVVVVLKKEKKPREGRCNLPH